MTDVETRTPQKTSKKRKSEVKQESPKKVKIENGKSPLKPQTPKQQKNQKNAQNSVQKSNKKAKQNNESEGKKVVPFAGTAQIQSPKPKPPKKEKAGGDAPAKSKSEKKPRKNFSTVIKDQLHTEDSSTKTEVIQKLETKLQAIQNRPNLTKTALRKIKLLKRLKNIAEGKAPAENKPKAKSGMSESTKRRERKKKAALNSEDGKDATAANKKGQQAKAKNEKKVVKPAIAKKEPVEESEDESDDDDEFESEGEEVVEGEDFGDDSGDEEGFSGEEEEESDEEEDSDDGEDSDEDEEESLPKSLVKIGKPQGKFTKSQGKVAKPQGKVGKPLVKNPSADEGNLENTKKAQPKKGSVKESKGPAETKEPKAAKSVGLDDLKKNELVSKNQSRYVVFVGNIAYDTTTGELKEHFGSCGQIKHVRIPTEKKTNKPRGFAYVEAVDEETYQKCLSKHHSHMKGRRINVLYTQGGKKKGDDRKKEIKVKNFKLGALRQQGKLLGSTKDSQKRSFRRKKQKMNSEVQES